MLNAIVSVNGVATFDPDMVIEPGRQTTLFGVWVVNVIVHVPPLGAIEAQDDAVMDVYEPVQVKPLRSACTFSAALVVPVLVISTDPDPED